MIGMVYSEVYTFKETIIVQQCQTQGRFGQIFLDPHKSNANSWTSRQCAGEELHVLYATASEKEKCPRLPRIAAGATHLWKGQNYSVQANH